MHSPRYAVLGLLVACSGSAASSIDPPGTGAFEAVPAPPGRSPSPRPQQGGPSGATPPIASSPPSPTSPLPAPTVLPAPTPQLEVGATIISATLGDECSVDAGQGFAPQLCAMPVEPVQGDALWAGCGPICIESNLQLSFKTGAGSPAKVVIASVTLHDAKTDVQLDTLKATAPQVWNGTAYAAWDEMLKPSADVRASYTLSAPRWSKISSTGSLWGQYKVHVTLKVDGATITLESTVLSREPPVAT